MCNSDDFGDIDFNIEKMNDKFCDSLDMDVNNSTKSIIKDMSTEIDSDEFSFQNSFLAPKKKLLINDVLSIKKKTKFLAEYLPLIAPSKRKIEK